MSEVLSVLAFGGGYNTRLVMAAAACLGAAAGLVGVFAVARRRALVADAAAHATLPGVAAGFLVALGLRLAPRSVPLLLAGSVAASALAVAAVGWMRTRTRLADDAAIASTIGMAYGLGVMLLSIIQGLRVGGQAGLDALLVGRLAGLTFGDGAALVAASLIAVAIVLALFKELSALAFDPVGAEASGVPVARIDAALSVAILAVVVTGIRATGLILIVAMLVLPAVAGRFWAERLPGVALAAAIIGAGSAWIGAGLSAVIPNLPSGPAVVLSAAAALAVSLAIAPRGPLRRSFA